MPNGTGFRGGILLLALVVIASAGAADAQRSSRGEANWRSSDVEHKATRGLSQPQVDNMRARVEIATAIADRFESDAKASGLAAGWRQATLDSLLSLPLAQLERVQQQAHRANALPGAIRDASADPSLLGDPDADLVYTPIPPCRFVDTRNIAGRFSGFRDYDISVPGSTYGGAATCHPTADFGAADDEIGALALNLTIIDPAVAPGFAAAKPTQGAPLSSLANWYEVGPTVQAANQGVVAMDLSTADPEFVVQTSALVHVIVDVFGAFLAPQATALEVVSVTTAWSILTTDFNVAASCPAGYSITGGGFAHTTGGTFGGVLVTQDARDGTNHGWRCKGVSVGLQGVGAEGYCEAVCGRMPGR